jgi:hypothetical protein
MNRIEILTPVGRRHVGEQCAPAPRLDDLNGKTIGLYWNQKPGGDVALERLAGHLRERYPDIQFKNFTGSVGHVRPAASASDVEAIAAGCAGVIGATAD